MRHPGAPGRRAVTPTGSPASDQPAALDAGHAQLRPGNPGTGDRDDEFWAGEAAELTDEEINRIDLERERAEAEATEDESRPGGPLWDAGKGEPYDRAAAAMLIAEARHAEYRERESSYYPYFHHGAAADSGRSGIAAPEQGTGQVPCASLPQDNERSQGHDGARAAARHDREAEA
jgi:hypothetical protein